MTTVESYAAEPWVEFRDVVGKRPKLELFLERTGAFVRRLSMRLFVGLVWLTLAGIIGGGWWWRADLPLHAETGIGYGLGLLAAACMVVLLIYPLRKRFRILSFIGPARNWFIVHMSLGITAPIAALYHCGFKLGSLNSQIALGCALVVSGSGLIGRFLYRKIHSRWSVKRSAVRKLATPRLFASRELAFLQLVAQRLAAFDARAEPARESLWKTMSYLWRIKAYAVQERNALVCFCARRIDRSADTNPVLARERDRLLNTIERYITYRTYQTAQVARVQFYERLFALWHVAHLPFFFLLVISVVVHVFAVHLY